LSRSHKSLGYRSFCNPTYLVPEPDDLDTAFHYFGAWDCLAFSVCLVFLGLGVGLDSLIQLDTFINNGLSLGIL